MGQSRISLFISERYPFWRAALWRPLLMIAGIPYGAWGITGFIRASLSDENRQNLDAGIGYASHLLPNLSWYWWVMGSLVLVIFVALEGGFRQLNKEKADSEAMRAGFTQEMGELRAVFEQFKSNPEKRLRQIKRELKELAEQGLDIIQNPMSSLRDDIDTVSRFRKWRTDTSSFVKQKLGSPATNDFLRAAGADLKQYPPNEASAHRQWVESSIPKYADYLKQRAETLKIDDIEESLLETLD